MNLKKWTAALHSGCGVQLFARLSDVESDVEAREVLRRCASRCPFAQVALDRVGWFLHELTAAAP